MTKQQFIQLEIEKEIALEMQQMNQYERLRDFLDQSYYIGFTDNLSQSELDFYLNEYKDCI